MGSSQDLYTTTDPNTSGNNEHMYCQHTQKQEPTYINVLQLRILTNIFKMFNIQKDEIHIVVNIVTAL